MKYFTVSLALLAASPVLANVNTSAPAHNDIDDCVDKCAHGDTAKFVECKKACVAPTPTPTPTPTPNPIVDCVDKCAHGDPAKFVECKKACVLPASTSSAPATSSTPNPIVECVDKCAKALDKCEKAGKPNCGEAFVECKKACVNPQSSTSSSSSHHLTHTSSSVHSSSTHPPCNTTSTTTTSIRTFTTHISSYVPVPCNSTVNPHGPTYTKPVNPVGPTHTHTGPAVVTAAAGHVEPVMALLALGAAVLL